MKRVLPAAVALLGTVGLLASAAPGAGATARPAALSRAAVTPPVRAAAAVPQSVGPFSCQTQEINPIGTLSGVNEYFVTTAGCLSGSHACVALGNDRDQPGSEDTQGVECADIYVRPDGGSGFDVFPVAEAICQNLNQSSDLPECADADISFELADHVDGTTATNSLTCGHAAGACNSGARNEVMGSGIDIPGGQCALGSADEVWSVDLTGSIIELPGSATTVASTANLASQHAVLCDVASPTPSPSKPPP